jgi:CRP-like cAMP-binding protein
MDLKNRSLLHRINQVSFFDGFSHIEKGKLLEKIKMFKKYEKKGWTIISEGAKGKSMYVVLEGVICITRLTFKRAKKKRVTLAKLKKGSVFGEISLLSNQNRTTGAITDSSLVIVMVIDKKTLESFDLGIQNSFRTQMILTLIRRLDSMYEKYRDVID